MVAVGGAPVGNKYNYSKEVTFASVFCCLVASSGGLLFGYDLGVAGGVSTMPYFEKTYFPSVYEKTHGPDKFVATSPYCKFNSQTLQLFQSSMYIAAFFASLIASYAAKMRGRKFCMICSGVSYLIGAALTTGAVPRESGLGMLVCGRICLGIGIGFANSSVTIYASEMSPPKYRGFLTLLFQLSVTLGILIAQLVNYGTVEIYKAGFRVSLCIAVIPACMILCGGIFLPESPSFLISKQRHDEGRLILQRIRGQENVDMEFNDIVRQTQMANLIAHPLKEFMKPCYRPQLTITVVIAIVHQMCGNNAIVFYAPQLFATFGSSRKSALLNTVIMGAVKVASTVIGMVSVDKFGRRKLLIYSGCAMVVLEVIVGALIGYYFKHYGMKIPDRPSKGLLAVICLFVANYAWSWGPLGWLIPAEIQPAEVRTAGMGVATSVNMLFSFVISQTFLSMLCSMHYWCFIFFACIVVFGIIFIALLLPECKGLPMEEVHEAFQQNWFWKRFPPPPRPEVPTMENMNPKKEIEM